MRTTTSAVIAAGVVSAALSAALPASGLDLYDGALGTSPPAQGYLTYFADDFQNHFTATTKTLLDTSSPAGLRGGFSNRNPLTLGLVNPAFPALDRAAGFTIRIEDLKLVQETHASIDRAGFSLIVLGSDAKGIELGFWEGQVFAQDDVPTPFVKGESALAPTTVANDYDLVIHGNTYALSTVGGPVLLSGDVRDYSASTLVPDPYELTNYLFLGDNTTSASAAVEFSAVRVLPVPEPGALATGILAAAGVGLRRRRRA